MRRRSDCTAIDQLLSARLDAELGARDRRRVDRHVSACLDCAEELESLRRTRTLVRSMPPRQVPPGLWDPAALGPRAVLDTSPLDATVTAEPPHRRARTRVGVGIAASVLALVGVWVVAAGGGEVGDRGVAVLSEEGVAPRHAAVTGAAGVPRPPAAAADSASPAVTMLARTPQGARGMREVLVMDYAAGTSNRTPVVTRAAVPAAAPAAAAGVDPETKYDLRIAGTEPIMDRMCVRIEAYLAGGMLREVLYLDDSSGEVLRRETYAAVAADGGSLQRLTTYLRLDEGTAADAVDPEGPAPLLVDDGAQRAALRAAGWWLPPVLTDSYRLLAVLVHEDLPGMPLHAVYSDGLFTVSLFSQPGALSRQVPPGARPITADDTRRWLEWIGDGPPRLAVEGAGFVHTLTGDAPREEMLRIAASIPGP